MNYLLDTNICVYLIKQRPVQVVYKFLAFQPGDIGVSALTVAELQLGVHKSAHPAQNQSALEHLLLSLLVANFDAHAAAFYGKIRTQLERRGTPIGSVDYLIAAHALSLDVTLVTNNVREFERVPGLKVENWVDG